MRESESIRHTGSPGAVGVGGNGHSNGATHPLDRSYLLRRVTRFPFPQLQAEDDAIRIRRDRRVNASFSGIPPLTRNGRG